MRKQKQQKMKKILLVAEIVLILAIATGGIIYFQKNKDNAIEVTVDKEDKEAVGVKVDGIDISNMSKEDAKSALLAKHTWNFVITYQGDTYEVENLFEKEIDSVLYDAYAPNAKPEYSSGSMLHIRSTLGCTIPQPRISIQPLPLQKRQPLP